MHHYLKAIGFEKVHSKKEINALLTQTVDRYSYCEKIRCEEGLDFCHYQKEYGAGIGLSVFGESIHQREFLQHYYCPFLIGTGITSREEVSIERRMDRESYVGICEDSKVGISLIFYMQNTVEYLKKQQDKSRPVMYTSVTLSGLCNSGTMLLPVKKSKSQAERQKEEVKNRMRLIAAAKNGDTTAIEHLTLEDIDMYSQVSRRLIKEDVFSIVETYIMPCGVECDQYSILGEIMEYGEIINEYTDEVLYILKLNVNELTFDVCVPKQKVLGEPDVGRRFKADMWLQGRINF